MEPLLEAGINFFNEERYFEAHEAWEDLWRLTTGRARLYYQGLIQTAVGLHHLNRGNTRGACAQLSKAVSKLGEYPSDFCGVDNGKLVEDIRNLLENLDRRRIQILRFESPLPPGEGSAKRG